MVIKHREHEILEITLDMKNKTLDLTTLEENTYCLNVVQAITLVEVLKTKIKELETLPEVINL